jgi:hypothetical protein
VSAVYALYSDPESAQSAVDRLRAAGVPDGEITVISSEPFESHEFGARDKATWIFSIATAGGAVGLTFAYWLTSVTEQAWPLPTGAMPIVANWPNLIIMFEMTMLFAVLSTVATLLITANLPRRRPALYDPAVSDGRILVGLANPPSSHATIEHALSLPGAELKTIP